MSRIGVDLDGVCYDFVDSLRRYLIDIEGFDPKRVQKYVRWEFYLDWNMTVEEFLKACHSGADAGYVFASGSAYPGTRDALQRLIDRGHTLHVITDRSFGKPGTSESHTAKWVATELPKIKSLTFSADKTVGKVDFMIDDKLSNYDALAETGVDVYLLNRPWNHEAGDNKRKRVDTLDEFVDRVLEKELVGSSA